MYQRVKSYTLTGPERVYALAQAVRYVAENKIPGAIVECGVWKGGSMMAVALTLLGLGRQDRDLHLFDTFEGMPEPTDLDISHDGTAAAADFEKTKISEDSSEWCRAPIDLVQQAVRSTGYDPSRIHLVKGKVEDTIPDAAPERIALLRLDTDWYGSTRHELEHLFPRLSGWRDRHRRLRPLAGRSTGDRRVSSPTTRSHSCSIASITLPGSG